MMAESRRQTPDSSAAAVSLVMVARMTARHSLSQVVMDARSVCHALSRGPVSQVIRHS